ncbi:MAG: cytochrome c3 family protein, partial [Desulfatitalea sp.]|nr:cytochrome c3 family protein [Desulfatitalea sp.]
MRKRLLGRVWIVAALIIFIFSSGLYGSVQVSPVPSGTKADVIKIDSMRVFGELEKPPVEFLHDAHTKALAKKNKDCTACHLTENDRISIKFKRIKDTDKITVMNVYHKECISCHGEMKVAGEKAGPVECNECHNEKTRFSVARQPMGFDKSLHFRHATAQEKKCEHCHHEYDEKAKKLFYAKGKEGTCRYCHKAETRDNLISMRSASHVACVDCHRKNQAKNIVTGPVECAGCHDAAAQQKIERVEAVPRMEGKQPDMVLLKRAPKENPADNEILSRMNFVPFDHKAHESYNNTCRGCHH